MRPLAGCTPIAYHPNPGELVFSQPTSGKPSPLMLRPGFNILFTGNLGTAQALPTVLAAAELLRDVSDVRFVLVGSGRLEEWLKGEVSKRGLNNIDLVGRFAPEHIPSIVSQASALLLSLVRDPIMALTVPSKTQAYLAAGRPIIACLDGEAAQVVLEAQAGIACSAEDASALAGAVRNLRALPPKERERMGIRGKAYYANNYEPTSQARRLMQLLGEGLQAPLVETKRKK
jgi:glycosyltransferase involved in cell wall biosynthesis